MISANPFSAFRTASPSPEGNGNGAISSAPRRRRKWPMMTGVSAALMDQNPNSFLDFPFLPEVEERFACFCLNTQHNLKESSLGQTKLGKLPECLGPSQGMGSHPAPHEGRRHLGQSRNQRCNEYFRQVSQPGELWPPVNSVSPCPGEGRATVRPGELTSHG